METSNSREPLDTLRRGDEADTAAGSMSFDIAEAGDLPHTAIAWDDARAQSSLGAALRSLAQTYRYAPLEAEADGAQAGSEDGHAPQTWMEVVQDPTRVASAAVTAGFVWWLTRSGGLLTTLLMGVPAWRHVDLLPVLARPLDDEDDDDTSAGAKNAAPNSDLQDSAIDALFSADESKPLARLTS
jgi:hypothetical protein